MTVLRWSDVPGKRRWRRVALATIVLGLAGGLLWLNRAPEVLPPQTARVDRGDIEKACWLPAF